MFNINEFDSFYDIYSVSTQKDYNRLTKELKKKGITWPTGAKITAFNAFPRYGEDTIILVYDYYAVYTSRDKFAANYPGQILNIKHYKKEKISKISWLLEIIFD